MDSLHPKDSEYLHILGLRLSGRAVASAAIAALPLIYFHQAVIGKVIITNGDGWSYNLPMRMLTGRMIADGTLPLWNPYTFAGMPLLAASQPGAFYPLNWLFALLSPGVAMNAVMIASFYVALIGAYRYARLIGIGRVGSLVTGITFAFSAFMISNIEHTGLIAAASWMPWTLVTIERLYQRASWRWAPAGAVILALQFFAGLTQMTFYCALVYGAYVVFSLAARERQEGRLRFLGAVTAMAFCGALLSAIKLWPALELQQQSERAQISYEYFSLIAMPPRRLLAIVFPYFFGGFGLSPYKIPVWDVWWVAKWQGGYVGMLGLLLSLVALLAPKRRRLTWFWGGVAVAALVLAIGAYLPFDFNHLLYRVPVYNLFRCSYRHLGAFSFAIAALAGMGVNHIMEMDRAWARKAVNRSILAMTALVVGTAVAYCFFAARLGSPVPPPAQSGRLTNAEAFVPLSLFALSVVALWFFARRRTLLTAFGIVALLFFDLAFFGSSFGWGPDIHLVDRLADPPTVRFIKSREPDLNTFRVASQLGVAVDAADAESLNQPNISIARGLQSVNGYDPLRLPRVAAIAGEMDIFGAIQNQKTYGLPDRGLDLLNVKYLLRARGSQPDFKQDGIEFSPINLQLSPGAHQEIKLEAAPATELAIISAMGASTHLSDGAPMVAVNLYTKDGRVIERELQAGRDTAEWAYDRADVRAAIKHSRPRIAESSDAGGFQAHSYLARLAFDRAEIVRVEFNYLRPDASLTVIRASLYDATTGASVPLDSSNLPPERWRRLQSFGHVNVYENLKAMPRAWFARRTVAAPGAEVLRAIKEGKLSDGAVFDPSEVALLETEDLTGRAAPLSGASAAEVKITRYEPHRIELQTSNEQAGFLTLSEIFYPGWEARVDGRKTPVYRTNYILRGIEIPPGSHRIEFVYRPASFRNGAICSALGLVLLLIGSVMSYRKRR
ncbi:MAG: hypothetical protein HONDAALG_01351 [Gammaproteobacteria bacterium]|nr:hypothetical protein [Gammaproteobacteria bacterium]